MISNTRMLEQVKFMNQMSNYNYYPWHAQLCQHNNASLLNQYFLIEHSGYTEYWYRNKIQYRVVSFAKGSFCGLCSFKRDHETCPIKCHIMIHSYMHL